MDHDPGSDQTAVATAALTTRQDLVVGLVAPVGVETGLLAQELRRVFAVVDYETHHVRLSDLIDEVCRRVGIAFPDARSRYDDLMSKGTELRKRTSDAAIAALLAVRSIVFLREGQPSAGRPRAFLLHSLKHTDEAELLKEMYGSRFLLVGATAARAARVDHVRRRLVHEDHWTEDAAEAEAIRLVHRDEKEREDEGMGQQVREVFPGADFFCRVTRDDPSWGIDLERWVRLLFRHPFETPRPDELGMYHAAAASMRSAALARQVGCAIIDQDGEVLVTGTNEVARPFGGQYWSDSRPDGRDFVMGRESTNAHNLELLHEVLASLREAGWFETTLEELTAEALLQRAVGEGGPLADSRALDLVEFGRPVHAEMAALMTAARRGTAVRGATLFTTTFPCHQCARHIVAAGIRRVVYREPYAKSKVAELYADSIVVEGTACENKILFEPFVGVAPRMFQRVFQLVSGERRKDKLTGTVVPWDGREVRPRLDPADQSVDELVREREDEAARRAGDFVLALEGAAV